MADKKTGFDRESEAQAKKERPYVADPGEWDKVSGPEFGGQADILQLNIGEVGGPFEYVGHQPMPMEGGKIVTVHLGMDPGGDTLRLPIAASFLRAVDQADIQKGDTFLIRRSDDVRKKSGIGKGQAMQIYAVKPKTRAARVAGTAAPF